MIITLTTDFGYDDHFVGVMKGVIFKIAPSINVIDICHNIPPQNVLKASRVLASSIGYFAKNTLHVVVVDPGVGSKRRILYVQTDNEQFLAPDNGVLSFLKEGSIKIIKDVTNNAFFLERISSTFHGRDIFSPVAAHIANGIDTNLLGNSLNFKEIKQLLFPPTKIDSHCRKMYGKVIDIDRFGNIITNISEKQLIEWVNNRQNTKIYLGNFCVLGITTNYSSCPCGAYLALINSELFVEVAKNLGNAAVDLNVKVGMDIIIEY